MSKDTSNRTTIRKLLAKKTAEFKNVTWTIAKAKSVFQGYYSPMPFDVWREAGLYLAKYEKGWLGNYARMSLRVEKHPFKVIKGGKNRMLQGEQ